VDFSVGKGWILSRKILKSTMNLLKQLPVWFDTVMQRPAWMLWGLLGILLAFYLGLMLKAGYSYDHTGAISLGLSAIVYRVWQRRQKLALITSPVAWGLGMLLLAWVTLKGGLMQEPDAFLRLLPVIAALGFALVTSGFKGLRQYWLEALILGFFQLSTMPGVVTSEIVHTQALTAKISTGMLYTVGFEAVQQGVRVILPTGSVDVLGPCSPTIPVVRLFEMLIFFLAIYPTTWIQRLILPFSAVIIGVGVNSIRVAILAVLTANQNTSGFDFWHHGMGSNIFSVANVIVFWLFWEALNQFPQWWLFLMNAGQELEATDQ
jgi:cyanoexosortase A